MNISQCSYQNVVLKKIKQWHHSCLEFPQYCSKCCSVWTRYKVYTTVHTYIHAMCLSPRFIVCLHAGRSICHTRIFNLGIPTLRESNMWSTQLSVIEWAEFITCCGQRLFGKYIGSYLYSSYPRVSLTTASVCWKQICSEFSVRIRGWVHALHSSNEVIIYSCKCWSITCMKTQLTYAHL